MPGERQQDGLVVGEAGGRIHLAAADRDALAEVRELDDRHVVGGQAGRASSAWSMIQALPYLPGVPSARP